MLAALIDQYGVTLERLQRSFVGPPDLQPPQPLPEEEFDRQYAAQTPQDRDVAEFRRLRHSAQRSAGAATHASQDTDAATRYRQYTDWLPFAHRDRVVLSRIADALGYGPPPSHTLG
jgi:hypothetical protein